jgi:hypothetical protein
VVVVVHVPDGAAASACAPRHGCWFLPGATRAILANFVRVPEVQKRDPSHMPATHVLVSCEKTVTDVVPKEDKGLLWEVVLWEVVLWEVALW